MIICHKRNILFIGAINLGGRPNGGEEFKNQLFFKYFNSNYKFDFIDTYEWKKKPCVIIKIIFFLLTRNYNYVVISASSLSTYRFIRLYNLLFPSRRNRLIYAVIGGYFPKGVLSGLYKSSVYLDIYKIIVEGEELKSELNVAGLISNVMVMPNFKEVNETWNKMALEKSHEFKFIFISSISKEKGVHLIFEAITNFRIKYSGINFTVDFYGPIDDSYKDLFKLSLKDFCNCRYCGYLDLMGNPTESYVKLSSYDAMLFPTMYQGEGFPGVIIDSYISGLPVIASDWNMNSEIVIHEKSGLIVPVNNPDGLADSMHWMISNPDKVVQMRYYNNSLALNYDVNRVLDKYFKPILI